MKISKKQTSHPTWVQLTFLPEVFPVNRSQIQDLKAAQVIPDTFGRKCLELLEKFAPDGSLRRMFVGLLVGMEGWHSTRCALTWKVRATKSSRFYCQLAVSMPRIKDTEFGLLPTVQTQGLKVCNENGKTEFMNLNLLPTPTAMMPGDVDMEKLNARRAKIIANKKNGNGFGVSLNELAMKGLLPTPRASDIKRGTKSNHQKSVPSELGLTVSQLNPQFLSEMMGFPPDWTALPFLSGEQIV